MKILEFIRAVLQKIQNNYKIRKCKSENHVRGNHVFISLEFATPWEEPFNGKQLRTTCKKYRCANCKTVFLSRAEWEFRDESEQFSAD